MFVFLDVDGVLNKKKEWVIPYTLNKDCLDNFASCFSKINARIILTTSWRKGFVSPGNPKNTPQISKLERELVLRGLRVSGTTSHSESDRSKAVREILERHPDTYLIIDDDISEFSDRGMPGLYLVNNKTGFTKSDMKAIQKILSKEKEHVFDVER